MHIVIAVDLEGVACVAGEVNKSLSQSRDYDFACKESVKEANAVAQGFFSNGVSRVSVWDNHNGSLNMDYSALDERVEVLCGVSLEPRLSFLSKIKADGLALIGYHGAAGQLNSVLSHTYSSKIYQSVSLNNKPVGEITLDSYLAAEYGVPVIMISGDSSIRQEALEFVSEDFFVETKRALGRNFCLSRSPAKVCESLKNTSGNAAKSADLGVIKLKENFKLSYRYQRMEDAQQHALKDSRFHIEDPYTVSGTGTSLKEFF